MKRNLIVPLLGSVVILSSPLVLAQLTVTPFDSAEDMAQSLVGPSIEISNVQFTGQEYSAGHAGLRLHETSVQLSARQAIRMSHPRRHAS